MVTEDTANQDFLAHARELSEAENPLPKEAEAAYHGPNELSMAIVRGIILGTVGWFAGNAVGRIGSKVKWLDAKKTKLNDDHHTFKPENMGAAASFVGAIMGAYSGSKDARNFRKQVDELQDITIKQNQKITDLQDELREQVKARNGNGKPKLTSYDPSWEEDKEAKDDVKEEANEAARFARTPSTKISASHTQHMGAQQAQAASLEPAL